MKYLVRMDDYQVEAFEINPEVPLEMIVTDIEQRDGQPVLGVGVEVDPNKFGELLLPEGVERAIVITLLGVVMVSMYVYGEFADAEEACTEVRNSVYRKIDQMDRVAMSN